MDASAEPDRFLLGPHVYTWLVARLRTLRVGFLIVAVTHAVIVGEGLAVERRMQTSSTSLLAPYSVTCNAALVTKLSDSSWSVADAQRPL